MFSLCYKNHGIQIELSNPMDYFKGQSHVGTICWLVEKIWEIILIPVLMIT